MTNNPQTQLKVFYQLGNTSQMKTTMEAKVFHHDDSGHRQWSSTVSFHHSNHFTSAGAVESPSNVYDDRVIEAIQKGLAKLR